MTKLPIFKTYKDLTSKLVYSVYVNSFSNLLELCERHKINNPPNCASLTLGEEDFYGTKSMDECLKIFNDPSNYDILESLMAVKLDSEVLFKDILPDKVYTRETENVVVGEVLNIQDAINDISPLVFSCEVSTKDINSGYKFISLILNYSPLCIQSLDNIRYVGSLLYNLVEYLETRVFVCEIYIAACGVDTRSSSIFTNTVKIKEFYEKLNLETIACIAHPSFYRRLILALYERWGDDIRSIFGFWPHGGYGYKTNMKHLTSDQFLHLIGDISGNSGLGSGYITNSYSNLTNNNDIVKAFCEDLSNLKLTVND